MDTLPVVAVAPATLPSAALAMATNCTTTRFAVKDPLRSFDVIKHVRLIVWSN